MQHQGPSNEIQVAVGIIFSPSSDADHPTVLVGQRLRADRYFGQWEFPGGKLEAGESPTEALIRELHEELDIKVLESEPFMQWQHVYPERTVRLHVALVTRYEGVPISKEGQAIAWVTLEQIEDIAFLDGNQAIVERLQSYIANR